MGDNWPVNGSYTTYFILKNEAYSYRPISRVIKLVVYDKRVNASVLANPRFKSNDLWGNNTY